MELTIQQRIRERREAFQASVDEMARLADLTKDRWLAIESGTPLTVSELGRVCLALAVDLGSFLRGEERDPRRSVVRFRQAVPIRGRRFLEARTLALAGELGRIGGGLSKMLEKPLPLAEARKTLPVSSSEEPWRQGYRLGVQARQRLGLPAGPIVELQKTLEAIGIHVATLPFSQPDVDAASLVEPGAMPILLLNQESARIAQILPRRTAMAHELCHLLHDAGESDLETRMSRQFTDDHHDDGIEKRARAFAPAFLAPPKEVERYFKQGAGRAISDPRERVEALARHWGLSWRGAAWHAKNCELIPSGDAEQFDTENFPHQVWHKEFERLAVARQGSLESSLLCSGRMTDLVEEAFEAGAISEGRAKEILAWG